eukprot:1266081-Pleurochrysis_carterae.AAC.3
MLAQLLNGRGALLPALATARQAARVGGGDAAADARAAAADGSPLHALRQRDRVVRGAAKDAARVVLERSSLRHPHHGARARHLRRGLARAHAVRELPHAVRVRVVLRLQDVLLHLGRWIPLVRAALVAESCEAMPTFSEAAEREGFWAIRLRGIERGIAAFEGRRCDVGGGKGRGS